jgi:glycosyltransferase involved in cell wall biosynthesis
LQGLPEVLKEPDIPMAKNILIYFQNSYRNIFFESFVPGLIKKGHNVYFLTKCERGILHGKIEESGVTTASYNPHGPRFFRFIYHWWFLVRYSRKNKIDIVYSHLQLANLIALFAQYFIRAKVIPCRHHVDEIVIVGNKTALRIDKMVNRLAKKIIVVSNAVKRQMTDRENVKADKITVIPLGYIFDLYNKPDPETVLKIKEQMDCHLLLIVIARMTAGKRHIIALQVLNRLVTEGLDIKMLILDRGIEEENLRIFVQENNLNERVIFTGFLNNTMDYVAAADLLLHPSVIEASNQVVREAAILEKPCIVCNDVGDFNEYIIDKQNSFLVTKENTLEEMCGIVREYYYKKDELKKMGARLKEQVLCKFSIENVVEEYLQMAY